MRRPLRYATTILLAAGIGLALAGPVPAQGIAQTYEFEPKDAAAFEAALKKHAEQRMEEDDPWEWYVYEVVAGENTGVYHVRSGGHSWADFDSYGEEFAIEAATHFEADVAPTIEETSSWISQNDTALTRLPEDPTGLRFAEVVTYHIEPGKQAQFDEAVGQIHDAVAASDWPVHYNFVNPLMGRKGPQKVAAFFYENYADMAEPETPFMEMMGSQVGEEKAEEILDQLSDAIRYTETELLRYRPDLSVRPAEETEGGGSGQ